MTSQLEIEVLTAGGCAACGETIARVKQVIAEYPPGCIAFREANVLEELDHAVELGVLSVPAVAINGELVLAGPATAKKIRQAIASQMAILDAGS